jgi:hypothetical protein
MFPFIKNQEMSSSSRLMFEKVYVTNGHDGLPLSNGNDDGI